MKRLNEDSGFTLIELLIVVAIIGIVASIGVAQVIRARVAANETAAIGSLKAINTAQVNYTAAAGQGGYAANLEILANPCPGSAVGFISPDLDPALPGATGIGTGLLKSGYEIDMVATGPGPSDCNMEVTGSDYTATAVPTTIGSTGNRGFNTISAGTIFFDSAGLATGTTPIQ